MKEKGGAEKKYYGIYFLVSVIILYLVLFLFWSEDTAIALKASGNLLYKILPVLLLVILFMGLMYYFVTPKTVKKYVGEGSGIKGWFLAISTGILSHGPIYVWYPLLRDLKDQGMKNGLVAVFLYNRAIKLPLLPLMVYYFGALFVAILLVYMIIASIFQGKIFDIIEQNNREVGHVGS